jgi:hypothetical protein
MQHRINVEAPPILKHINLPRKEMSNNKSQLAEEDSKDARVTYIHLN